MTMRGHMNINFLFLNLFIFINALHVSYGFSAHHQEHTTVHTVSGIAKPILLLAATVEEMELVELTEFHLLHGSG
jgi:hypothetical protein